MGSRLFDEIREQRGLAYSVSSYPHAYADVPVLQLSAGLGVGKCLEAYRRMRDIVTELREQGPTEAEVERARAYAAGARAIAFENSGAVARHAAQQAIVYGEDVDPDAAIERLDAVTFDEVARGRRGDRGRTRRSPASGRTRCRSLSPRSVSSAAGVAVRAAIGGSRSRSSGSPAAARARGRRHALAPATPVSAPCRRGGARRRGAGVAGRGTDESRSRRTRQGVHERARDQRRC